MKNRQKQLQAGFVSIFTVLFFTLLITIVTVGFVRIMLLDQTQAIDYDLSQSAYDAAQSGVEDGKRVLDRYEYHCSRTGDPVSGALCTQYQIVLASATSGNCRAIWNNASVRSDLGLSTSPEGDVVLSNAEELQQRYTCLLITTDTDDVENRLEENESWTIPLRATGGAAAEQITVKWFAATDKTNGIGGYSLPPNAQVAAPQLPTKTVWSNSDFPALLRIQLIGHQKSAPAGNLDRLDNYSRTLFLYPASSGGVASFGFNSRDPRTNTTASGTTAQDYYGPQTKLLPTIVNCSSNQAEPFSCTTNITIEAGLRSDPNRDVYLRITPLYRATTVNVQMRNVGGTLQFNNVQPIVDSTGRTNNVFRRVQARVARTADTSLYALQSSQPLCKDMIVTNDRSDFSDGCDTPALP